MPVAPIVIGIGGAAEKASTNSGGTSSGMPRSIPMTWVTPEPAVTNSAFAGRWAGSTNSPVAWSSWTMVPGRARCTRWLLTLPSGMALTVIVKQPSARTSTEVIESARGVIDGDAAVAAWERALRAPAWAGSPVWIHSDLLRPNVLVRDGRVCAVIDFGGVGVGDPAADVIAAWSVFGRAGRGVFRAALEVDDGTWERARGFALHQAALIVPYYGETNPGFAASARRTIEEVLADLDA